MAIMRSMSRVDPEDIGLGKGEVCLRLVLVSRTRVTEAGSVILRSGSHTNAVVSKLTWMESFDDSFGTYRDGKFIVRNGASRIIDSRMFEFEGGK